MNVEDIASRSTVVFENAIQHNWRDNFWGSCFPR